MREILSNKDNPDPQKLARTAIHLLEQEIHKMGYDIEMGAELEFMVKVKDEFKNEENPLGLPEPVDAKTGDYRVQQLRDYRKRDSLFPDSAYICYSYKET